MRAATISRWQITRTSGERVVFEAATEREAQLLARESFPDDLRFEISLLSTICERCRAEVPAGQRCEACHAKREARKRPFIVRIVFLLKAGWTPAYEARVRAFGIAGAAVLGVREAKRSSVKPRARIAQTKIDVINVRRAQRL